MNAHPGSLWLCIVRIFSELASVFVFFPLFIRLASLSRRTKTNPHVASCGTDSGWITSACVRSNQKLMCPHPVVDLLSRRFPKKTAVGSGWQHHRTASALHLKQKSLHPSLLSFFLRTVSELLRISLFVMPQRALIPLPGWISEPLVAALFFFLPLLEDFTFGSYNDASLLTGKTRTCSWIINESPVWNMKIWKSA